VVRWETLGFLFRKDFSVVSVFFQDSFEGEVNLSFLRLLHPLLSYISSLYKQGLALLWPSMMLDGFHLHLQDGMLYILVARAL
jgi:hypothetical protein